MVFIITPSEADPRGIWHFSSNAGDYRPLSCWGRPFAIETRFELLSLPLKQNQIADGILEVVKVCRRWTSMKFTLHAIIFDGMKINCLIRSNSIEHPFNIPWFLLSDKFCWVLLLYLTLICLFHPISNNITSDEFKSMPDPSWSIHYQSAVHEIQWSKLNAQNQWTCTMASCRSLWFVMPFLCRPQLYQNPWIL